MKMWRSAVSASILAVSVFTCSAGGIGAGRYMKSENPFAVSFNMGYIGFDEGEVRETRRAYDTDRSGVPDYSAFLSAYTLEDLGFDDNYLALGTTIEKQWSFVTLHFNALYSQPSAEAVAEMKSTASNVPRNQRGYYIGADEVMFNGRNYEFMWIPDGTKFRADIETLLIETKAKITPFHLGIGAVNFSPWVHFGIYGGLASYEIDAGPPEGVVSYEVPPKEYVIKGRATGAGGLAIPQIGGGGEVRFGFGSDTNRMTSLVLQGDFSWMSYSGSPNALGFNVKSTRHVDFNWMNVTLSALMEIPLSSRVDLLVGATYRSIRTDITMDSIHRTEAAQSVLSEKYDKHAEFAISQVMANVGLRF